jgi:hypothetical protein
MRDPMKVIHANRMNPTRACSSDLLRTVQVAAEYSALGLLRLRPVSFEKRLTGDVGVDQTWRVRAEHMTKSSASNYQEQETKGMCLLRR